MSQLIIAVMAIALTALVLGAGANWISMTVLPRREAAVLAEAGLTALASAASAYRFANGGPPSAPLAGGPPTALVPAYIEAPRAPGGMGWSYGSPGTGRLWVCLSGPAVSEPQYKGMLSAAARRPAGTLILNTSCGASADGTAPATYPAAVALTYHVFP